MVGLIKARLAADAHAFVTHGRGIGEFPADRRLGRGARAGHHDEGILGRGREIARNHQIRLGIADQWRIGAGGGHVPAHFKQRGIFRGNLGLVGALPLDGDKIAVRRIQRWTDGAVVEAACQREGHIALRVGGSRISDRRDRDARAEVGAVHHVVITHLGIEPGRAVNDDGSASLWSVAHDFPDGTGADPVGQACKTLRRGPISARKMRRQRRRARDRHRDLLVQVFLEYARGGHGVPGQHILAHDPGRHDRDRGNGAEHEHGHRQRNQDFNQREAAPAGGRAAGILDKKFHQTGRVRVGLFGGG